MSRPLYIIADTFMSLGGWSYNHFAVNPSHWGPFDEWTKSNYRDFKLDYPKFFKMDRLSKMAFLAAEVLLRDENLDEETKTKTGVLIFNQFSSIDSDIAHQHLIGDWENYFPSPAVFVYTLPNIMIGEICIRHGLKGENLCLIADNISDDESLQQVEMMFDAGMKRVLVGGIDYINGGYKAWMALIGDDNNASKYSQLCDKYFWINNKLKLWKDS